MAKGFSLISGVIFLAVTIGATLVVYQLGMPAIQKVQSAALVEQMKQSFSDLDELIRGVASEGRGSKRTVYLDIDSGKVYFNKTDDVIYWEYETAAPIISPRTSQTYGNVIIGSNLETKVYEANYTQTSPEIESYVLENEYLKVYVRKIGSETSFASLNTSALLLGIYQKDIGRWLNNQGFFEVSIDNQATSKEGNGYTSPVQTGTHLPYGSVTARINTSYSSYSVNFTLESGTDFLIVQGGL